MSMNSSMTHKEIGDYLKKAATGNNETVDSQGGFLVTQAVVSEIVDNLKLESPIWDKARKFALEGYGNNGLKIPYNNSSNEVTPTTGARAYWVDEAVQKTISKTQIGVSTITCGKLVVRIPTTDELKADSTLLADYLINEGTKAIKNAIEYYMIRGSSSQAIKGIANAGDKATLISNCASDITEANMISVVDKLNPIYHKTAEWYFSPQQFSVICSIDYTNESTLVFENGDYWLYGKKVNVLPQLTEKPYHVILGDFGTYGLVHRLDIKVSEHIRFDYDESEFRLVMRVGGDVLTERQTLEDATTYAAFVVCDAGEAEASSSSSSSSSSSEEYSTSSSSSIDSSSSSSSSSSEGYSTSSSSHSSESSESVGNNSSSSSSSSSSGS